MSKYTWWYMNTEKRAKNPIESFKAGLQHTFNTGQ